MTHDENKETFFIGLKRKIEPNKIRVKDCVMKNVDSLGYGSELSILSLRGDEFYIDRVNAQK